MKKGFDFIGVTVVFYCHDGQGNLPHPLHSMFKEHLEYVKKAGIV